MAVDYTPSFDPADVDSDYGSTGGDITVPTFTANMKPFRFWCQRALPLVYDDSLSYYEVLCKVVDQMNGFLTDLQTATGSIGEFAQQFVINQTFLNNMAAKLGQDVDTLETYINNRMEDFTTAYEQLQSYVNNYFDNLDVQVEINNKLDAMAQDGTFNTLFDPVITAWMTAKTAQIDSAISNQDAVQAQQNARISVLEGRMDGFSSLPSGSTSGNAELLDIRTNFLGETYPTAGDAVRSSDMIASGFQSIGFTRLTDWNGNKESSVYDTIVIDVAAYKGGHVVVIANMDQFVLAIESGVGIGLYGSNVAGKTVDANATQYPFPDGYSGISNPVFKNFSIIPTSITGEERVLMQLAIPNDFAFQYLKLGNVAFVESNYTSPAAIVYATSWSKTPVDATLSIAGDAADAKATGDAISSINTRLGSLYIGNIPLERIKNSYPNASGGFDTYANWDRTDYTEIPENTKVLVITNTNISTDNYFYDASKNVISRIALAVGTNEYPVPDNAKYFILSNRTADFDNFIIKNPYVARILKNESDISKISQTVKDTEIEWTIGYRIQTNTSIINPALSPSTAYSCLIIPVEKGEKYVITADGANTYAGYCITDSQYHNLGFVAVANNTEIIIENDGYLICNTTDATKRECIKKEIITDLFTEVRSLQDQKYTADESSLKYFVDNEIIENPTAIYHVGADRTYTSIGAAVAAWAAESYPNAVIFVDDGIYKEAVIIEGGHTLSIIGESKEGTIIHTTSGNYVDAPIYIKHGTVTVKNMTLLADHSENPAFDFEAEPTLKAYAIHIDGGTVGGVVTVENCKLVSYQAASVGTGTIPNSKIRLIDCDCYGMTPYTSDSDSYQYSKLAQGSVLWHLSNPDVYPDRGDESFDIINCRIYQKNFHIAISTRRNNQSETMPLTAIGNIVGVGRTTTPSLDPLSGPATPTSISVGNNLASMNYTE